MTDIITANPDDLTISLAETEKRLPPLMRIKPFREQVLPVGNTKFWGLVEEGKLEVVYVAGIAYVVVKSALKLIAESPKKPKSPGGNVARMKS